MTVPLGLNGQHRITVHLWAQPYGKGLAESSNRLRKIELYRALS